MRPYDERFPVGSKVRVASEVHLQEFRRTWKYHHKLEDEQLAHAGEVALVLFFRAVKFHRALKRLLLQQAEQATEFWRKANQPDAG